MAFTSFTFLLSFPNLQRIATRRPVDPIIPPEDEDAEKFGCMVCYEVRREAMVSHVGCFKLICARDAITLLNNNMDCPNCRGILRTRDLQLTLFMKPTPIELQAIEEILYYCRNCDSRLTYESATNHYNDCSQENRYRAPEPILPRGRDPVQMIELVSNPVVAPVDRQPRSKCFVLYLNGIQLRTRSFTMRQTAQNIIDTIANLSDSDPNNITLYKFIHKKVDPSDSIATIAASPGAQYLMAFDCDNGMQNHTVNLIFQELGPTPTIPEPIAQNNDDWFPEEIW